jgi:coenzyme F420-dependent glucose-6-phosphate dehydrogenase
MRRCGYAQPVTEIGYALSSEEHRPDALIGFAKRAEEAGFTFAMISDHFHPWTSRQGQSPFVWSVLGGLARETSALRFGTGVTCPLVRIHPAIVAQAAATVAAMMPGRFFLGVGTGENLNEHVVGRGWPAADERLDMLEESVEMIRELWKGRDMTKRGKHYTVEQARIYTMPDEPPPIYVAAAGSTAAELAGRIGDGLICTKPDKDVVERFASKRADDAPRLGMLHVCWAKSEDEARRTALEVWPNAGIQGELGQELPLPRHFEQAAKNVREDDIAQAVVCGPDPERHVDAILEFTRPASTTCTCTRSGRTRKGSSASTKSPCCRKRVSSAGGASSVRRARPQRVRRHARVR